MGTTDTLRLYGPGDPFRPDGYPVAWHTDVKYVVRQEAGHRCVRCHHPYVGKVDAKLFGLPPSAVPGGWSRCDTRCTHGPPVRWRDAALDDDWNESVLWQGPVGASLVEDGPGGQQIQRWEVEAAWRILTVHHLTGDKADCRWWNLAALCQRCHLTIQGKVRMDRPWPHRHTEWFQPYAAGWYAWKYHGVELTRVEVDAQLADLLDLERWPSLPLGDA